ncbi:non-hydrolyzing UDP-N-acetylglucosamine 2-epimerase [Flavobacterium pallidum]|uniref:UDP-N-acetylglucosamine 2-epimerase (non-hydrolyzing) n=1 Tax=Flavobacterium pallidum TaxID=2172098 RepID=A0A2S1SF89_9FLAO|nr:UDP-N-acetylglucosamine 2-epimerase (non-hydrolyzing) [Flavobacterium pallidum]AWI25068.1 UDP-N-acetylglucosamine 2-epimerase (non-hydrolyzing) [Flavobacterium pallidum]
MKSILFLFGTRPEAIKMAPLIHCLSNDPEFRIKVGVTAQHREMLDQVLDFFEINVDYDLNVMSPDQKLHTLTSRLIADITNDILLKESFDFVLVQGDTTTVLAASLAAFYQKVKVVHLEAGLRSGNMDAPFPEEMNRILTSKLASIHLCPTENAKANLFAENIKENVYVVGNTVIDALFLGLEKLREMPDTSFSEKYHNIDFTKKIILVTCHRRENFGQPFESICKALLTIAAQHQDDVEIVYPVHPNPNVQKAAHQHLVARNIKLISPLDYPDLIWMMSKSYMILTDSGGIQEEAPSLGKPVIVLREVTERIEGITAGNAVLAGSSVEKIIAETSRLLSDRYYYDSFTASANPYGDGNAGSKIVALFKTAFSG